MGFRSLLETSDVERIRGVTVPFFAALEQSLPSFPASMREVMQQISVAVSLQQASMTRAVICVFLFVRFFCPGIVSPHMFGLARETPNLVQQRNLVLVSKMVLNVATGVRFDSLKEEKMLQLNSIVDALSPACEGWLDRLCARPLAASSEKRDSRNSNGAAAFGVFGRQSWSDKTDPTKASLEALLGALLEHSDILATVVSAEEAEKISFLKTTLIK